MTTPLELSVVRIYSNSGKVVGAGFLVSQKHVLTCAHVVADALGLARTIVEKPSQAVSLDFPIVAAKQFFTAKVVFWRPVNPDEFAEDIAGLELESAPPEAATYAQLVTSEDLWGHGFQVLGFPLNQSKGAWATGELRAPVANGWVQLEGVKQQGYALEAGFSGAPVWDEKLMGIAGMAVAAEISRPDAKAAFMIPTKVLYEAWSELGKQGISELGTSQSAKFFISYRTQDPDVSLAQQFYNALKAAGHQAFMAGESIRLGENWAERINRELQKCDYFLLLLSLQSATSEMVTEEVRRAKELRDLHPQNKPMILPIRINFPMSSPLNYDLRGYLSQIQQREWNSPADTPKILEEILALLATNKASEEITDVDDELSLSPVDKPSTPSTFSKVATVAPPLPVAEPEWEQYDFVRLTQK